MLECIAECQRFIEGMTYEQFQSDPKTYKAVVWNLMVIGEAARHIPPSVETAYPEVPWVTIRGMRNHIVHGYDKIDSAIVWRVVTDRLPGLVAPLERVLREAEE